MHCTTNFLFETERPRRFPFTHPFPKCLEQLGSKTQEPGTPSKSPNGSSQALLLPRMQISRKLKQHLILAKRPMSKGKFKREAELELRHGMWVSQVGSSPLGKTPTHLQAWLRAQYPELQGLSCGHNSRGMRKGRAEIPPLVTPKPLNQCQHFEPRLFLHEEGKHLLESLRVEFVG